MDYNERNRSFLTPPPNDANRNLTFLTLAPDLNIETDDNFDDDMDVCDDSSEHEVHYQTLVDTPGFLARLEGHGTDPRDVEQRGRGVAAGGGIGAAPRRALPASSVSASGHSGARFPDPDAGVGRSERPDDSRADRAGNSVELPRTSTQFVTFRRNSQLLDEMRRKDDEMRRKDEELTRMAAELEKLRGGQGAHRTNEIQSENRAKNVQKSAILADPIDPITDRIDPMIRFDPMTDRIDPMGSCRDNNTAPPQLPTNNEQIRRLPTLKLGQFDGTTPLETFLAKFENCSVYYGWYARERLCHLRAGLDGEAGQVLWTVAYRW